MSDIKIGDHFAREINHNYVICRVEDIRRREVIPRLIPTLLDEIAKNRRWARLIEVAINGRRVDPDDAWTYNHEIETVLEGWHRLTPIEILALQG